MAEDRATKNFARSRYLSRKVLPGESGHQMPRTATSRPATSRTAPRPL